MNEPAAAGGAVPRWLPWAFVLLLVLPFHPYWVDFEQVRRGLLLVLAGATLLLVPSLGRVRGETALLWFLAWLVICAVISVRSLQEWEAIYRIAHWLALLVVLRLGAAAPGAFATPLATMLLLTSLFGLLQRAGVAAVCGYGVEREPVSVFGNLNVASEWTAVAATAVAVLGTRSVWLGRAALVLAAAYLAVNQSRSGLIALPIGLLLLLAKRRCLDGAMPLLLALAGAGVGYVAGELMPRPAPADHQVELAEHKRANSTLDVRWQIARSSSKLFAERPLFGWGPGQFAVQYPRVRSDAEIETSSHGRQFATEVRTAHDDWLELLVEGGLPALLLFAGALFALQRGTPDKTRLLPLFVLLLLMFVRAPLGNAPAVAVALLLVGSAAPPGERTPRWAPWLARAIGLVLAGLGLLPVVGNQLFAPYQDAVANGEQPPLEALQGARTWMWWEPRWLQLLAQEEISRFETTLDRQQLTMAQDHAAELLRLRPHEPTYLVQAATALSYSDVAEAKTLIQAVLGSREVAGIDPPNPQAHLLLSQILMIERNYDAAIRTVSESPHPTLRAGLRTHFHRLERLASERGDAEGAARCALEVSCLDVLSTIGVPGAAAMTATTEHVKSLLTNAQRAGRRSDLRPYVLSALHYLNLGEPETANNIAASAQKLGTKLEPWQREQLGDKLKPLLEHEVWFAVLRR